MATITKPMALDESFNTTESTSRNQADVLAGIEQAIVRGFGQVANAVSYDNTDSGLTADNVQDAIDEVDDTVDGLVDDVTEISSNIESTQTVSGNPITLTDAAPINAESLVVEFSPKQDLHGYDHPWVGGAGKNKWNFEDYLTVCKANNPLLSWTETDGVYAINSLGNLYETKYSFANTDAQVTLSVDIKLHNSGETETVWVILLDSQNNEVNSTTATLSADYTHLTVSGVASKVWITYQYGRAADIKCPQIESGSSATSYAPYSNICPITGYMQTSVEDVGKNLVDYTKNLPSSYANVTASENEDGTVQVTGTASTTFGISLYDISASDLPSGQYVISMGGEFTYYANAYNGSSFVRQIIMTSNPYTINLNYADYDHVLIEAVVNGNETYNKKIYPMIRKASDTDATFEPYASTSATIQFGQTVYGGRSNFTDGGTVLPVKCVDMGSLTWTATVYGDNTYFYAELIDAKLYHNYEKGNAVTSCYKLIEFEYFVQNDGVFSVGTNEHTQIWVADSNYNGKTANEFTTAISGQMLVYELSTPTQLSTPPTDLKLLQGVNNITTNGTTINLGYQPDNVIGEVKGEIEKCAVDAEFMQFTDGTDTFTDVNLSLDALSHTVSVVGSKIEQKRFICFEVMDKMGGVLQGILASCIAFADGAKTPSGTAFRAYIESLQMYVNFRIYGSGGSYTLAYQSETSFSASAFYVRVRMMNNL